MTATFSNGITNQNAEIGITLWQTGLADWGELSNAKHNLS